MTKNKISNKQYYSFQKYECLSLDTGIFNLHFSSFLGVQGRKYTLTGLFDSKILNTKYIPREHQTLIIIVSM